MVGLLFPGQGSQHVGMGRDLAERFDVARETFEEADDILGFALSRCAWDGPEEELTLTKNAQPAILVHSIAVWRLVSERLGAVACGAGHSLGEFSAYVAAGSLSFADAVRTVRRRGELMFRSGEERPGSMAAILGLDDDAVERACVEASERGGIAVPANYNSPGQVVISGDRDAVERAMEGARAAGAKRAITLNVSGAFHSPLMASARAGLEARLAEVALSDPAFAVISNVTAAPVRDAVTARRLLLDQLTSPVRWGATVPAMQEAGASAFVELGPGNVLTGLLRRIDRSAEGRAAGTADQVGALLGEAA